VPFTIEDRAAIGLDLGCRGHPAAGLAGCRVAAVSYRREYAWANGCAGFNNSIKTGGIVVLSEVKALAVNSAERILRIGRLDSSLCCASLRMTVKRECYHSFLSTKRGSHLIQHEAPARDRKSARPFKRDITSAPCLGATNTIVVMPMPPR
jgi:hypothetical protein